MAQWMCAKRTMAKSLGMVQARFLSSKIKQDWEHKGVLPIVRNDESKSRSWFYAPVAAIESINAIKRGSLDLIDTEAAIASIRCSTTTTTTPERSKVELVYKYGAENGFKSLSGNRLQITSHKFIKYQGQRTYPEIEEQLKIQPLVVGFSGLRGFDGYRGNWVLNILHYPSSPIWYERGTGNYLNKPHYLLLVGHGTDKEGYEFYKFLNCWGPKWGAKGYFYMHKYHYPEGVFKMNTEVSYPVLEDSPPSGGVLSKITLDTEYQGNVETLAEHEEKYKSHFSVNRGIEALNIEEMYKKDHAAIRADPTKKQPPNEHKR